MSLSKRELVLLGVLIVAGGIYLVTNFLFQPLQLQIKQMKNENNSLSQELLGLQSQQYKREKIWQKSEQICYDYENIRHKVPEKLIISNIIDFMELNAGEAGVKLLSVSYQESQAAYKNGDASHYESSEPTGSEYTGEAITGINEIGTWMIKSANFQVAARGTHFNMLSFIMKIENAPRIYRIDHLKMTRFRQEPTPVVSAEKPLQGVIINNQEEIKENAVPEFQDFNDSYIEASIDFTVFYQDDEIL
ncbi:MAG: hypothetical protein PHF24_04515 [Syntrophomonas sp.]|nr:hypothetical protein [Syntrophomonas sp.]